MADKVEFDRDDVRELLSELDRRLRDRGTSASVYVVGGAAIALSIADTRRTQDVDAVVSDRAVMEEAAALARERAIPSNWLNDNARPWIPPLPGGAGAAATAPGLRVDLAPPRHLLAMKLVALRRQDVPDIVALVGALSMGAADPADFADLLAEVYTGEGRLAQVLGVPDEEARTEALSISRWLVVRLRESR